MVDLRSDTVTRPTAEMRRAMAQAEVGDDGYGEDPTVNELEEAYAARVGKEAAVYVPSGTMANQIALRCLAPAGTLVVAGRRQHIVAFEYGAAALNAGVQFHLVDDTEGAFDPGAVAEARALTEYHQPVTGLVCVEQTHMASGGRLWSLEQLAALRRAAGPVPVHMDGARLFNAEVATGVPAATFAGHVTTVMSCLSKGLGAPVGSMLAGPADVMEQGRIERKRLGGAMRQAGVIAAAGLVALRTMVDRLADDHRRARQLAGAVAERWPEAGADPAGVQTNMVMFRPPSVDAVLAHLAAAGVLADSVAPGLVRLVTHYDVDDAGVELACKTIAVAP